MTVIARTHSANFSVWKRFLNFLRILDTATDAATSERLQIRGERL